MRVEFSAAAERDLRQIALYIGTDSPACAISFVLELRTVARQLGEMPNRFQAVGKRSKEIVRRRAYRNYVIFYRHNDERVAVLRIVHGSGISDEFLGDIA